MSDDEKTKCVLGLVCLVAGYAVLSHYGWQLPLGIFLLWTAYNIEKGIKP
jgi:uncharacterized membrane protein YccC